MAAFERVLSGIPEMDKALDNIRLGDNVVFRVSDLSEFRMFVDPYVEQAKKDGRNIIYFRFASHEPLVEDCPEVKIYQVPLTHRFETFTVFYILLFLQTRILCISHRISSQLLEILPQILRIRTAMQTS